MLYDELPIMKKLLIQWKYRVGFAFELKDYFIQELPGQIAVIKISCKVGILNGQTHILTVPSKTFITNTKNLSSIEESTEHIRLMNWLNDFDATIYAKTRTIEINSI